ncbi:MAG: aminotransferase class I/II-fold pyridoxal phosphate-dependent enzyme [Kofleriaceae bacterium]|nr:aminotransferase class I/II-fold pyridoxal phosphate-dependent enzyme [Kofleriaceae bacterium]MCL4226843.1 aminotransferase class I/II-fold pyridoxal phosphate-dependent enzyme [Myxococcales bacterium]
MTPRLALDPRVAELPISPTLAAKLRAGELAAQGQRVHRLGLGQSPFPVPSPVVHALRAAASERDYLPPGGLPTLRVAVADFFRRRHGITFAAEDVVVGPGSKELMFLLQLCFDGDILIPTPSWVSYQPQAILAGRRLVALPGGGRHRLMVDPDTLAQLCQADDRPRMIFLNSPSNPTGLACSHDEIAALAQVCRRHGVVVLSDEIYADLDFSGRHASMARAYPEGTIVASGLSKWCGAGGWRLGTVALPEPLRPLRRALEAVASETYSSTSAPIQHAAVTAFRPSHEIETYLADARRILALLMRWTAGELAAAGLDVPEPEGGFYLFPGFGPLRAALARRGVEDDVRLTEALLDATGVMAVPGSAFGMDPRALRLRLALVDFDGAAAMAAVSTRPLDLQFLEDVLTPMWDAAHAMTGWLASLRDGAAP